MKIALISDIHSNLYYLEEVLKQVEKESIEKIYCLGDLVGYYDKPNEVIELIKEKKIICIKGNHEKYLLGELDYNIKNESIYRIKEQRKIITDENLEYLSSLPKELKLEINDKKIYITHSLPNDSSSYVYDLKDLDKDFLSKYDYYCYGHTHIPIISYQYGTCILNSGSVGQPRDYTKKPSFIVVDLFQDSAVLKKVHIDYNEYCNMLSDNGYNESLIKILKRDKNEKN